MMRGYYHALHSPTLSPPIFLIPTTIQTNVNPFLKQQLTAHFRVSCCSTSLTQSQLSQPSRETTTSTNKNNNRRRRAKNYSNNDDNGDFVVVNFYKFVFVKDPEEEVAKHLLFLEDLNIRGRVYLNEQGINAQYSGPSKDALAYVEWLKKDKRFSDILVQISPALNGHAFPKLKLRYKPSLVQASYIFVHLEGGSSHLPLLDPSMRATPLAPSAWRKRLEAVKDSDEASNSNLNTNLILLDVRNGIKSSAVMNGILVILRVQDDLMWTALGALHLGNLKVRVHCSILASISHYVPFFQALASDPLANVDKEKTDILMYCTGGIRCDVYSTILRRRGFRNLYTLKGGVSHYLKNEGPVEWVGNLFVFDSRLSLPPGTYKPEATTEANKTGQVSENPFAMCYICDSQISELRHRNCANLDCNLLFL
ncbi:hypothetical protein Patl1_19445 [Pistacia atlantica]|uniref:Uncharacterized protein n=1 Tax=Pistacia atlantica TaxID=434234 RepID=A0ACC1C1C2_9ROSI|nr:hypothetical protein Patl1_19445 [Pistacia atlantica]